MPKFGTLKLQALDIYNVAMAANSTATDCYTHVYFADAATACITASHKQLVGNALTGFETTIEDCAATVQFAEYSALQQSALVYPDPWGQPQRCMMSSNSADYVCAFPDDAVVQAAADYTVIIYSAASLGSSNAEAILVAVLCVAAFAILLPHSKEMTNSAGTATAEMYEVPQLHSKLQEIVLADVTFAAAWSTCSLAAYSGVSSLLHPNLRVLLSEDSLQYIAFAVFLIYIFNATFVVVSVMTKQIRPMFRLAYESTLLFTVAFMIPYNVAPMFHSLFQFCTAATIVFVAFRDASFNCIKNNATGTVHMAATAGACAFLLLPLIIDCDAVPATTEIPLLITAVVHIASAGASASAPTL